MANGEVKVSFDGIDLDDCIKEGLEFNGNAICSHCNQTYYFQLHITKKVQSPRNRKTSTTKKLNYYSVTVDFSKYSNVEMPQLEGEPAESLTEGECVPCNGCTPNCPKKGR